MVYHISRIKHVIQACVGGFCLYDNILGPHLVLPFNIRRKYGMGGLKNRRFCLVPFEAFSLRLRVYPV